MKIRQEKIEVNGIGYNTCPICKEAVKYPEGVYFRNGVEVHTRCIAVARMRRGAVAGVDYNATRG